MLNLSIQIEEAVFGPLCMQYTSSLFYQGFSQFALTLLNKITLHYTWHMPLIVCHENDCIFIRWKCIY